MSLKDDIMLELVDLGVTKLDVDRDAELHGEKVVAVTVWVAKQDHFFTFARRNNMTGEQMGSVIRSYLPEGDDDAHTG